MNQVRVRLVSVPTWIPLSVSVGLAGFLLFRGQDYLESGVPPGDYNAGLNQIGIEKWGYVCLIMGIVLLFSCGLRAWTRWWQPLFATHALAAVTYGVLTSLVLSAGPAPHWYRAWLTVALTTLMHVARSVSLYHESKSEAVLPV